MKKAYVLLLSLIMSIVMVLPLHAQEQNDRQISRDEAAEKFMILLRESSLSDPLYAEIMRGALDEDTSRYDTREFCLGDKEIIEVCCDIWDNYCEVQHCDAIFECLSWCILGDCDGGEE